MWPESGDTQPWLTKWKPRQRKPEHVPLSWLLALCARDKGRQEADACFLLSEPRNGRRHSRKHVFKFWADSRRRTVQQGGQR